MILPICIRYVFTTALVSFENYHSSDPYVYHWCSDVCAMEVLICG